MRNLTSFCCFILSELRGPNCDGPGSAPPYLPPKIKFQTWALIVCAAKQLTQQNHKNTTIFTYFYRWPNFYPVRSGFGPAQSRSGPVRSRSGPAQSTSGPARSGSGPARSGPDPVRSGLDPLRSGPDLVWSGPDPARPGPDLVRSGLDPVRPGPDLVPDLGWPAGRPARPAGRPAGRPGWLAGRAGWPGIIIIIKIRNQNKSAEFPGPQSVYKGKNQNNWNPQVQNTKLMPHRSFFFFFTQVET